MIIIQAPFLLTNIDQIPKDLVKTGIHLEGNIFDGNDLKDEAVWKIINENLNIVKHQYGEIIHSLHYPMNNANYISDPYAKDWLSRFVEIAHKFNIQTIVLHSNYFQSIDEFKVSKINETRDKYLKFFQNINDNIMGSNVKIGVENMPIIGDKGNDYDSVFVLPSDFENFNFENIGITWDIGHWAYTYFILDNLSNFSTAVITQKLEFNEFATIREKILHTHFSSFKGTTYPFSNSNCEEGIIPSEGTIAPIYLANSIKEIDKWEKPITMTLEIREDDYKNRVNIRKTIDWINNIKKA
ncbi:hypothetical protein HZB69_01845 [Candidatus Amesbacteria bacterium]|nr:hypothetical protein [Candidatus Amesbacteria bacterium]